MLNKIISLVFFLLIFNNSYLYSDISKTILPKEKPSIFKKSNKAKINELLIPEKKPDLVKKKVLQKNEVKTKQSIKKKDLPLLDSSISFIIPQKKPRSYKIVKSSEKSKILKQKDFDKAKIVFENISKRKWQTALKKAQTVKDRNFRNLVQWLYLKEPSNQATFSDYQVFISQNSNYPRIGRLQYLAERKINTKSSTPTNVINWFSKYPPVSGLGKLRLAEALSKNKIDNETIKLIKEGWHEAALTTSELRYFRNKFKRYLDLDDYIRRADRLAWNNKYWDLKRMLRYLPKDQKALYNARQILMSNSYGVDNAISKVPGYLKNDIGLQYDRLKWRARRGRLESSLEILYKNSNKSEENLIRADLWWKQREKIVRSLLYKKRYKTAYKIASEHSLSFGPEFAEAEWLSGWIAHAFLNSQEYAINHFLNFYENVSYPISLARGAYWLGKSSQTLGDEKNAEKYFSEGAKFLTTYYGQLSLKEINNSSEIILKDQSQYSLEYEKEFNKNILINHVILLKELDKTKYSKDIIKHLSQLNIEKGSEVLAAQLSTKVERYDYAIQISKKASYEKRFYLRFNYPIITTPKQINNKDMPNPSLVLSIIRQESEFDRKANSSVGAKGMMQLMKYTAKVVAKQAKLPYSISGLTNDPEYNIKLGTYYFHSLLKDYNGYYPFALAAYNAGPKRVKTWRRVNGDPTKGEISFINWIELIRFEETRNYVQRVLENVNVYNYMISQNPSKIGEFFR